MTGHLDEAFERLNQAENVAGRRGFEKALAMIHRIRGNLYFPLGKLDDCLAEHELARRHARRARSPEDEARALGGLGDAEYARGRMRTAHRHYERCIERCRQHGFGRVEVAHLSMLAGTLRYLDRRHDSLTTGQESLEGAIKVGHRRAEMLASALVGMTLFEMGDIAEARRANDAALAIARQLNSKRFQSLFLLSIARSLFLEDMWPQGIAHMRESLALSRETGMTFIGPAVLSTLALFTDDPEERETALDEGERVLDSGCVGHCHFWFYRDAIDVALALRDWSAVDGYAGALEAYTQSEPLPWTRFVVARGRALAAFGRGDGGAEIDAEIDRLIGEAERVKHRVLLPELLEARGHRGSGRR